MDFYFDVAADRILSVREDGPQVTMTITNGPFFGAVVSMTKMMFDGLVASEALRKLPFEGLKSVVERAALLEDSERMKALAKVLAFHGVRNGSLEDIHSDGVAIDDALMKDFMIDVTDRIYSILRYWERTPDIATLEALFGPLQVPSYWQHPVRLPIAMSDLALGAQGRSIGMERRRKETRNKR